MSLSLAIALNVALDLGILSALAFVMSRPRGLRPHHSQTELVRAETAAAPGRPATTHARAVARRPRELAPASS